MDPSDLRIAAMRSDPADGSVCLIDRKISSAASSVILKDFCVDRAFLVFLRIRQFLNDSREQIQQIDLPRDYHRPDVDERKLPASYDKHNHLSCRQYHSHG